jgi:SSS family solute:Na+ symporter
LEAWVVVTGIIFAYLLLTALLGVVANRRLAVNVEDFFLYGRKAGFIVLYLTVVATYHSAFAFLGSGGFFYTHGIGFWDAGAWTVLVGAITYVLGSRIWALGKRFGYITPADMLADFYESEAVRVVTALVSVLFTILYIQVQAQGLGYILSVASGGHISYELAVLILLGVAAAYLMAGGLRAVYWTDVMQGVWMYLAIWVGALVLAYKLFGGPFALWREVAAQRPDLLTLPGPQGFFTPGMWFGMMVVLSFGIVFQPHMMIRYYTAVSGTTIKWLGATTPIFLMTLYIPAALVGLGGAVAMPDLAIPDRIFPELLFTYAPPWLTGIILAGAAAAAMSTLDSPRRLPAIHQAGCVPSPLHQRGASVRVGAAAHRVRAVDYDLRIPGDPRSFVRSGCAATHARDPRRVLPDTAPVDANGSARRYRSGNGNALSHTSCIPASVGPAWRSVVRVGELPSYYCRLPLNSCAVTGDGATNSRRG